MTDIVTRLLLGPKLKEVLQELTERLLYENQDHMCKRKTNIRNIHHIKMIHRE